MSKSSSANYPVSTQSTTIKTKNRTKSCLTVSDDDRGDDAGCRGGTGRGSGRGQGGHFRGRSDDVAHRAYLEHVGVFALSIFIA